MIETWLTTKIIALNRRLNTKLSLQTWQDAEYTPTDNARSPTTNLTSRLDISPS